VEAKLRARANASTGSGPLSAMAREVGFEEKIAKLKAATR
jgi:hypothetical protein